MGRRFRIAIIDDDRTQVGLVSDRLRKSHPGAPFDIHHCQSGLGRWPYDLVLANENAKFDESSAPGINFLKYKPSSGGDVFEVVSIRMKEPEKRKHFPRYVPTHSIPTRFSSLNALEPLIYKPINVAIVGALSFGTVLAQLCAATPKVGNIRLGSRFPDALETAARLMESREGQKRFSFHTKLEEAIAGTDILVVCRDRRRRAEDVKERQVYNPLEFDQEKANSMVELGGLAANLGYGGLSVIITNPTPECVTGFYRGGRGVLRPGQVTSLMNIDGDREFTYVDDELKARGSSLKERPGLAEWMRNFMIGRHGDPFIAYPHRGKSNLWRSMVDSFTDEEMDIVHQGLEYVRVAGSRAVLAAIESDIPYILSVMACRDFIEEIAGFPSSLTYPAYCWTRVRQQEGYVGIATNVKYTPTGDASLEVDQDILKSFDKPSKDKLYSSMLSTRRSVDAKIPLPPFKHHL